MARILKEFRITEISACDKPAQVHAKMCIMKRHDEGTKMAKYPWMNTAADEPIDDQAAKEITLDRVRRVGREYLNLRRTLLMKNETGTNMDDLIQKAGETAERIIELEAKELRKLQPHLTEAKPSRKFIAIRPMSIYGAPNVRRMAFVRLRGRARGFAG